MPQISEETSSTHSKNSMPARGVCHGDVRPENILVRADGSVVVVDFEMSTIDANKDELNAEIKEVKSLLASLKEKG